MLPQALEARQKYCAMPVSMPAAGIVISEHAGLPHGVGLHPQMRRGSPRSASGNRLSRFTQRNFAPNAFAMFESITEKAGVLQLGGAPGSYTTPFR